MKPPHMACAASARRLQQLAWRFLSPISETLFYMYLICFHKQRCFKRTYVVRCFLPLPPAAPRSRHAFVARPGRAAASVT